MGMFNKRARLAAAIAAQALAVALASPAMAQDTTGTTDQTPPPPADVAAPEDRTGASATAQNAGDTAPGTTAPDAGGDIVVTARRRAETLIDVPVTVSVISEELIQRNNATDLTKIGELTPTVIVGAYKSNGGGSIAIRGISSPANQAGFEQAVSVAIDGVQTADGRIAQLGFFDIRQVEVLKGPQALFFGKNSSAGVISVSTADPTRRLEFAGRAVYEFVGNEVLVDAAASGPLSEGVGARIAVRYRHLDGWLRNTARPLANPFYVAATGAPAGAAQLPGTANPRPGDEELLGRLTLRADAGERFTARLKLFGARSDDNGAGVATQNIGPCTGPNPRMYGVADPNAECRVNRLTTQGDLPPAIAQTMRRARQDGVAYGKLRAFTVALDLGYELSEGLTLDSTTGYNLLRYVFNTGLDQTTYSQLAFSNLQRNRAFSQELRLTSDFDSAFNFMVGTFYQRQSLFDTNDTKLRDSNYNAAANRFSTYEDVGRLRGTTLSAFVQALYEITPDLELAAGARYTRERKRYRKNNVYGIGTFNTANTVYPGSDETGFLKGRFSDENVSPEVSISYRPGVNRTLYAAYKTGFKSGGFGLTNPLQTGTRIGDVDFDSEKARGFEVGAKGLFLNNRLRASATAFAYEFKDLQVNTYDPARVAYTINNAGAVRQRGAEIELNLRASDILTLHGAFAYTHNRFRDFVGQCFAYAFPTGTTRATAVPPPPCTFVNATALTLQQDFGGRAPARSPDYAGNAGFAFDVPSGSYKLGVTGDAFYSSSYFAAETMAPSTRQDGFFRFNASVSVAEADDRWSLSLIGRNLSNEYYLLYAADRTGGASVPGTIGEQRGVVARGREVALQAAVRF